jgi:hypothetical protein
MSDLDQKLERLTVAITAGMGITEVHHQSLKSLAKPRMPKD